MSPNLNLTVDVKDAAGKKVGSVDLPAELSMYRQTFR